MLQRRAHTYSWIQMDMTVPMQYTGTTNEGMQLHQPEYHIHVVPLIQLPFWIVLCCVILPQRLFDHLH